MFKIKQNDTSPAIKATLKNYQNNPINLIGATVRFHMKHENGREAVDSLATVVDDENGIVEYSWQAGDTKYEGIHFAEFEVTYEDESIETFPNDSFIKVKITRELF